MSKLVTIYGGSGFVGPLHRPPDGRAGLARPRRRAASRTRRIFVRTYGVVGQVEPVFCNIRDDDSVRRVMLGARCRRELRRHLRCQRPEQLRGGAGARGPSGSRGSPPSRGWRSWCRSRPSARTRAATASMPGPRRGRGGHHAALPARGDPAAVGDLRRRGSVLQPLRRHDAACRRSCRWSAPRPVPAGLRRRRRAGRREGRHGRGGAGRSTSSAGPRWRRSAS